MATVHNQMTNLANEVRTLSGTENLLGIVAMTEKVNEANTEISEQTDLISQMNTALDDLGAVAGGSSSVETCAVRVYCTSSRSPLRGYLVKKNANEIETSYDANASGAFDVTFETVLCGSLMVLFIGNKWFPAINSITGSAEIVNWSIAADFGYFFLHITAAAGETVTIQVTDDY